MRDQKLDTLSAVARQYSGRSSTRSTTRSTARCSTPACARRPTHRARASRCSASRAGPRALQTYLASDSTAQREIGDLQFAVALEAARTRRVGARHRGGQRRPRGRGGAAAVADAPGAKRPGVVLRRRLLGAAGGRRRHRLAHPPARARRGRARAARRAAGRLPARARVQPPRPRMERAARRVAQGDFGARFESGARDELGQLARTLDAMQQQLAELETRAAALHRHRVARAAHADLLAWRLPGAARGRGARRGDAPAPSCASCASRSTAWASSPPSCSTSRGWRPARWSCAPSRPTSASWPRAWPPEFTPALAAHESHLELRLTGGRVEALCDPERVAQIMRILIDNALNHTPAGTDVVLAATRRNGRARLSVTDFGTGIKRGDLERVFEPFFTSDDAQGSGLGPGHRARAGRSHGRRPQRRERPRAHDLRAGAPAVRPRARRPRRRGPARCGRAGGCGGGTRRRDDRRCRARRPRSRSSSRRARAKAASTRAGSTSASRPAW